MSDPYSMTRQELEQQVIYLNKKREALESAIDTLQKNNANLQNTIAVLEQRIKGLVSYIEVQKKVTHEALETANRQNNEYLVEIQRLRVERDCQST